MIVIFVGDKPSPRMKPGAPAFSGALCESRLKRWIDQIINPDTDEVYIHNRGDLALAGWITVSLQNPRVVFIALGVNASNYFSKMGITHYALPHPSGRNRQINNKSLIDRAIHGARKYLESRYNIKKVVPRNYCM